MNERILLVGDKRICPQVAYVMDWQNCAMVERLSAEDVIKYSDHKIVICDFKRKRKRYIPVGGGGGGIPTLIMFYGKSIVVSRLIMLI